MHGALHTRGPARRVPGSRDLHAPAGRRRAVPPRTAAPRLVLGRASKDRLDGAQRRQTPQIAALRTAHRLHESGTMYSKARIAGHPIHPMLVGFPIALFTATIGLELAHIGTQDAFFYRAAMMANIAGLVMGALAAVPGPSDPWRLPPQSRARDLATQHALYNLLTLALFGVSGTMLVLGWNNKVM